MKYTQTLVMIVLVGFFVIPPIVKSNQFKTTKMDVCEYVENYKQERKKEKLEKIIQEQVELIEELNETIVE